ncbi:MAG: 4Fe-4S dicluster domain-containing protein [Gammaproteobacteria bacterium]|nr:4Fe-4S dicluster domain-containing protein [Gammaproteobacteria bacterium]
MVPEQVQFLLMEKPQRGQDEMPCIGCGDCFDVCPVNLMPQELFRHARSDSFPASQQQHLFDCIECGDCDNVCPSHIPLLEHFKYAKSQIAAGDRQRKEADLARRRMQQRNQRKLSAARIKHEQNSKEITTDSSKVDDKLTYIQEAVSRTLKKRADKPSLYQGNDD